MKKDQESIIHEQGCWCDAIQKSTQKASPEDRIDKNVQGAKGKDGVVVNRRSRRMKLDFHDQISCAAAACSLRFIDLLPLSVFA
jgi:hypothetical protein